MLSMPSMQCAGLVAANANRPSGKYKTQGITGMPASQQSSTVKLHSIGSVAHSIPPNKLMLNNISGQHSYLDPKLLGPSISIPSISEGGWVHCVVIPLYFKTRLSYYNVKPG